jgi:pimeloyl-ACP methyl ester carboxylesterase
MAVCVLALSAASLRCTKAEPPRPQTLPVSAFVVSDGVRLHYLDWGGNGKAMLLLAGLGNDARVFDTFAPRFTDSFHVYALTRRGFGKSDKPAGGYDTATRVEDIRAFLDQMKIDRAHLVGHSLAGDEMTLFATKYPERVMKLVYLDAAYDRHRLRATLMTDPAMTPSQKRLYLESIGSPEAAAITVTDPPPDERRVLAAYMKASDDFQPDYRAVKAPALAFYAIPRNHPASAHESSLDRRRKFNAWWVETAIPLTRANRDRFRREMRGSEVVELPDADHQLFLGRTQEQVAGKTLAFLNGYAVRDMSAAAASGSSGRAK